MDNAHPLFPNLERVVHTGALNASKALGAFSKNTVESGSSQVSMVPVEELSSLVRASETSTVVALRYEGEDLGMFLLILEPEAAKRYAASLAGAHSIDPKSILTETGNILSGAFATALNQETNVSFMQSVPDSETDITAALVQSIIVEMAEGNESLLAARSELAVKELDVDCTVLVLFSPETSNRIATQHE